MHVENVIAGYCISLIFGGIVIQAIIDKRLLKHVGEMARPEELPIRDSLLVITMGAMERFAYTSCILLNEPRWIAVWLGFKVLTRWRYAGTILPDEKVVSPRHKHYLSAALGNVYVIGNLLSVAFGVVGGLVCQRGII